MVTIVDEAPLVNDFLYYCVASGPSFAAGRKPSYFLSGRSLLFSSLATLV